MVAIVNILFEVIDGNCHNILLDAIDGSCNAPQLVTITYIVTKNNGCIVYCNEEILSYAFLKFSNNGNQISKQIMPYRINAIHN